MTYKPNLSFSNLENVKNHIISFFPTVLVSILFFACKTDVSKSTVVAIVGEDFCINKRPALEGVILKGIIMEGLILNSRMVQGIFDHLNPGSADRWKFPELQKVIENYW